MEINFSNAYEGGRLTKMTRDVRELVSAGPKFDAEFAFLYHGQLCPQFIEDYTDTYLANLVRRCLTPGDVELALRTPSRRQARVGRDVRGECREG